MPRTTKHELVSRILDLHGQTFCRELRIPIEKNTPSALFQLLCFSIMSSTRIGWRIAMAAVRAVFDAGWKTPQAMDRSTWRQRTNTLNRSGYARYDESTSRMLGDTSRILLEKYGGDLRKLRERAERKPDVERRLLKEFKGLGDTGVDIFFREVQVVWDEVFPFADRRALTAAEKLGLGHYARSLARLVHGQADYTRLVAALARVDLMRAYDQVEEKAMAGAGA